MKRQALVIGLGQFGMSIARALAAQNVEVLAVDKKEDRTKVAAMFVTEAACFDATDEVALARLSPNKRDVCICSIGDESKEASIICTALLKQMGASRVIARSNDALTARILTLIGATEVINPELEFGKRFANQIIHSDIRGEMPLGEGVLVTEVSVPKAFIGKRLRDLALPKTFGITVVAVRTHDTGAVITPSAETTLSSDDVIVVVAKDDAVAKMMDSY